MAKLKMKGFGKKSAKDKPKKVKKEFDFEAFKKSFTSLDPQNMGSWPLVVKLTCGLAIMAAIAALVYALPVKKKMGEIQAAKTEQDNLLKQFEEKESKARSLEIYKQQILQMQNTFSQLLDQLPKETRIPDLVEDINMRGVGSGVEFKDIAVNDEVTKELFIEQPITIASSGDYHEFGNFVSGIASLSRIITMHDFTIENTKKGNLNELPQLEFVLNANTYRAKDISAEAEKKGDKTS